MASPSQNNTGFAWQPITPRGIAAFAHATLARLVVCQTVFAAFSAIAVTWLVFTAVFPSVRTAVQRLPQSGEVRHGVLAWPGVSPMLLSEGRVVAFGVDLDHTGRARVPADVFIEFGRNSWRAISIGGYAEWPYRRGVIMTFNKPGLEPWWGAWRTPILGLVFLGWMALLLVWWGLQATFGFPVAWLLAFFANRSAGPAAAWRLTGAAMLPASLVLWVGIVLYGGATLNLVGFGLFFAGHIVVGWLFVIFGTLALPRDPNAPGGGKNPFKGAGTAERSAG